MKWFSLPAALLVVASCASAQAGLLSRWRGMSEDPAAAETVVEAESNAMAPTPVEMDDVQAWNEHSYGHSYAVAPECCERPKASWCKSLWSGFCSAKCFCRPRPRPCGSGCGTCCGRSRGLGLKHFFCKPATPLFGGPCCRPACPCGYRSAESACCEPCCGALGCGGCGKPSCCGPRRSLLRGHGCLFGCLKPRFGHGLFSRCRPEPCGTSCGCGQPDCPQCGHNGMSGHIEAYYGPEMPVLPDVPADTPPAPAAQPEMNQPPTEAAPAPGESKSARAWLLPGRFHLLPIALRGQ